MLGLAPSTVSSHLCAAMRRLGLRRPSDALGFWAVGASDRAAELAADRPRAKSGRSMAWDDHHGA